MKDIEVRLLNPDAFEISETVMVTGARLTQRGHIIKSLDDFMDLFNKGWQPTTFDRMLHLPHANIQRFGMPIVVVMGASRRFLAQITRHQDDVHFISASLQYSDYSGNSAFCVPYSITKMDVMHEGYAQDVPGYYTRNYLKSQKQAAAEYEAAIKAGVDHDAAAYMLPQGLRNVLLIGATPFEWKHMISQRICNRNTLETQWVMLKIWEELNKYTRMMENSGPDCQQPCRCREGSMACTSPIKGKDPVTMMHELFPAYYVEEEKTDG